MRTLLIVILCSTLAVNSTSSAAPANEVLEVFAKEYVKEQVKHQVANFMDKNHQVLGSSNPHLGTDALKFVGKMIATYNLLSAKTDKDRAIAAFNLVVTPEPTTALIIVALQIVDSIDSMRHVRALAQEYERIAKIEEETRRILKDIYTNRFKDQARIYEQGNTIHSEIQTLLDELDRDPVFKFVNTNDTSITESPTADQIHNLLLKLQAINTKISELSMVCVHLETWVNYKSLGLSEDVRAATLKNRDNLLTTQKVLQSIEAWMLQFFATAQSQTRRQTISRDLSEYSRQLKVYTYCVETINKLDLSRLRGADSIEINHRVLYDCQKKFPLQVSL